MLDRVFGQKRSHVPVNQASLELLSSSACVGAECLMKLLGNYCRNKDMKTIITVGVVGEYGASVWICRALDMKSFLC